MIDITEVYKVSASVNLYLSSKTLNRQLLNFGQDVIFVGYWLMLDDFNSVFLKQVPI
jgi:beta-xylosidase